MIKKISILTALITTSLFSVEIPMAHAQERAFSSSVELNAQVIQLSNAGQAVTSQISGHLEKYFVEPGQRVKAGQKIALIESIKVSQMTADYISLKKQYIALEKNYEATSKLYDRGMTSMSELNNQSIKKDAMLAQINALKSQLTTLRIDTTKLNKASSSFILYAHSAGKVSRLLLQLHTVVRVDEAIINIIKEQAFYIKSFVPIEYASKVKVSQKMVVDYNNRDIVTHVTQVMPSVDERTQRIIVLSSVDEKADDLFINTYVKSTLYFDTKQKHIAVEKSALSFFNNEWVVFVEKEGHDDDHDEHENKEVNSESHTESNKDSEVKSHKVTEHEEHTEVPYEARVVEIITEDDKFVAVNGLEKGEEYVSAKSYYVKSMMLKSSLGEHGH